VLVEETLERYFRDVNAEEWDDFRGIWHDEAELRVVGGVHLRGREDVLAYYPRVLASFPAHHDEPYAVHVAGDVATVEIRFRGETRQGVVTEWEALDVFRFRDGLISSLATWYDVALVVGDLRRPGPRERRLARVLEEAGAGELAELPVQRELPPPAVGETDLRLVVDGVPLAREDVEEAARLWSAALELARVAPGERLAARPASPGFGDAALRARACVVVGDGGRELEVLERPETGVVAAACGEGGLHVLEEGHEVELVGGELVVTPLGRRALPLRRYATGVRAARVEGDCACGSPLPRIEVVG